MGFGLKLVLIHPLTEQPLYVLIINVLQFSENNKKRYVVVCFKMEESVSKSYISSEAELKKNQVRTEEYF